MDDAISVTGKIRQGNGAVFLPVPGQEMIIEDIDDKCRVMSVSLPESPFALRDLPVPVGEGVNLPVQNDASIYLSLIAFDALPLMKSAMKLPNMTASELPER